MTEFVEPIRAQTPTISYWGTISAINSFQLTITGLQHFAVAGDEIVIKKQGVDVYGEILSISHDHLMALLFEAPAGIAIGSRVYLQKASRIQPCDEWLGNIVNYYGKVVRSQGTPIDSHAPSRELYTPALPSHLRRSLGARLSTGWNITDTVLPICRGQKIGIFAGSGVGKSTFLGSLGNSVSADIVVIALIGERSREIADFINKIIHPEILKRTVIVAATANESPSAKKRAAYCAMATAEYFRDQGKHVFLLFDSITRFAEAHREVALLAGETPALNAYPPSTIRTVAELTERAGPGIDGVGDITAAFSVLVAGSDMEEPVADMMRGILDGHFILSRHIAEKGQYPAIDVLRSVSRALPNAASAEENILIQKFKKNIALIEEAEPMVKAGLYEHGMDLESDKALELKTALEAFITGTNQRDSAETFLELNNILSKPSISRD